MEWNGMLTVVNGTDGEVLSFFRKTKTRVYIAPKIHSNLQSFTESSNLKKC